MLMLGLVIGDMLFVHGGLNHQCLGVVPGRPGRDYVPRVGDDNVSFNREPGAVGGREAQHKWCPPRGPRIRFAPKLGRDHFGNLLLVPCFGATLVYLFDRPYGLVFLWIGTFLGFKWKPTISGVYLAPDLNKYLLSTLKGEDVVLLV